MSKKSKKKKPRKKLTQEQKYELREKRAADIKKFKKNTTRLGKNIKNLRGKMNQSDLAREVDIAANVLSRLESGTIKNPKMFTLISLATELSTTVDFLVGRSNKMKDEEVYRNNSEARKILRTYAKLSQEKKKMLSDFAKFLKK